MGVSIRSDGSDCRSPDVGVRSHVLRRNRAEELAGDLDRSFRNGAF